MIFDTENLFKMPVATRRLSTPMTPRKMYQMTHSLFKSQEDFPLFKTQSLQPSKTLMPSTPTNHNHNDRSLNDSSSIKQIIKTHSSSPSESLTRHFCDDFSSFYSQKLRTSLDTSNEKLNETL